MNSSLFANFNKIIDNCVLKFPEIDKLYLTGSQVDQYKNDRLSDISDIDILIILSTETECDPNNILSFLAKSSIELKTIIHPLIISNIDIKIKLEIPEYKNLVKKGILVYKKSS